MMNKVLTSYLKPTMILIDDAFNLKIKVLFIFFFIVKTKKNKKLTITYIKMITE